MLPGAGGTDGGNSGTVRGGEPVEPLAPGGVVAGCGAGVFPGRAAGGVCGFGLGGLGGDGLPGGTTVGGCMKPGLAGGGAAGATPG